MMFGQELSLPVVVSVVTAICAVAASWGVVRFQAAQHDRRIARLDERCDALGRELSTFREAAAQRFVTVEMMSKLEERVVGAIDRLADRLDRIIEARANGPRTG
ncbi:hypothetical protein [Bosea sp. BK604]|uniref:hypothetical protein n=1 Tax=Bosea sp. BK604 TaxID=2512180 RepID=UPI00104285B7|nr:hypothetical protein [Bosea sp. BK604]TCR65425.1 hypothetical protein EV560_105188 [Bosea sp. BK604]